MTSLSMTSLSARVRRLAAFGAVGVATVLTGAGCSSALSHVVKESEVSVMSPQYAQPIETARRSVTEAEALLQDAQAKARLAEAEAARADYLEAVLDEREAAVEEAEAKVWVMRARYELVKLEQLRAAQGNDGVSERLIKFKEQVADREGEYLKAQREHVEAKVAREKSRMKLNTALKRAGLQPVPKPEDPPKPPPPLKTVAPPAPPTPTAPPTPPVPAEPAPAATPEAGKAESSEDSKPKTDDGASAP